MQRRLKRSIDFFQKSSPGHRNFLHASHGGVRANKHGFLHHTLASGSFGIGSRGSLLRKPTFWAHGLDHSSFRGVVDVWSR